VGEDVFMLGDDLQSGMSSTTVVDRTRPVPAGTLVRAGAVAIVAGLVLVGGTRLLLGALVAIDPALGPFQWGPVLGSVVGFGVAATLVYGLFDRYTERADRLFVALAVVVFALMLLPVFVLGPSLGVASATLQAALVVLHVLAAAGIVGGILRTVRRD
jgi:hypothetical protein